MWCSLVLTHFSVPDFLKMSRTFWSSYYFHLDLHPKESAIQLSCVGWCLNVCFETSRPLTGEVNLPLNDGRASNYIDSLEHRCNAACVLQFYHYYNRFFSSVISKLIPENHVSSSNAPLSRRANPYVIDWPMERTIHYGQNWFFSRTIRTISY